jgi:hypothetical protein
MRICSPFVDNARLRVSLKDPLIKELGTTKFAQKLTNNNDWAANRTLSFIRTRV